MDLVCPPEISGKMATVQEVVKNWNSNLKAPNDLDMGKEVSLKTKFCHFTQFGST